MSTNPYIKELMSGTSEEDIVARFTEQLNAAREAVEAEKARKAEEEAKAAAKESAFLHMAEFVISYINEYANPKTPYSLDSIDVKTTMKSIDSFIELANTMGDIKVAFGKEAKKVMEKPVKDTAAELNFDPIQEFLNFFFED